MVAAAAVVLAVVSAVIVCYLLVTHVNDDHPPTADFVKDVLLDD